MQDDEPTRVKIDEELSLSDIEVSPQASAASLPAVGAAPQLGRYELLMELAAGGMATVYVGRQRGAGGFQRVVAIKRMHPHVGSVPELAASFLDEARIASLIHHPNVVNVHDVHDAGGEHLLVMDYVDGTSLAHLIRAARKRRVRVPRPAALRILIDALRGLHAAHEQTNLEGKPLGVVHRDATPHNILLGVDGSVRITDFGIAKAAERSVHTATGMAKGKFRYMAPEQARGGALDRRVDVFAMGVVAWELLTGERLFTGEGDAEVLLTIASGDYPPPSKFDKTIPADIERTVMKALAVDPNQRWPSAHAFADALEDWARSAGELATPTEVARVVDELEGRSLAKRRHELGEIIAGRKPPLVSRAAGATPGQTGSSMRTSAPLTVDSVEVAPAVDTVQLRRHRRRKLLVVVAALGGVASLAAGAVLLLSPGKPPAPTQSSASAPVAPKPPERVRIQVRAESDIAEIRAPGISDVSFTDSGARFDLPRSSSEVEVTIRFSDDTEIREALVPDENLAIRLRQVEGTHTVEDLPVLEEEAAKPPPAPRPVPRPATRPPPKPTLPGLEKNPYE